MHQSQSHQLDRFVYTDADFLGQGSFGKVYKGKDTSTGQTVAIKIMDMSLFTDQFMIDSLKTEIAVMKELKEDHVVQLVDVFGDAKQTILVIEICDGGDLRGFIEKNGGMLDESVAQDIMQQLMKGFQEMVKNTNVIPTTKQDIKPENSLIKNNVHKVADFGFAAKVDITGRHLIKECVGTPLYMAPQLLERKDYSAKSDIWSIGILAYEMVYGRQPWPCRDCNSYLQNMKNLQLKFPYEKVVSEEFKQFIRSCLQIEEKDRIGWEEVFNHPFLTKQTNQKQYNEQQIDKKARDILSAVQSFVQARNLNVHQVFNQLNNKGGQLNKDQFYQFLTSLDQRITTNEALYLFNQFDKDHDGSLSFDEFQKLFCEVDFSDLNDRSGQIINDLKEIIKANNLKLQDIFKNFDADKQGTLDFQEFSKLIKVIAPAIKTNDIQKIFKDFDENGDGTISFEEFKRELSYAIPQQDSKFNPNNEKAKVFILQYYQNTKKKVITELKRIVVSNNVQVDQIFKNFDKDGDSQLEFTEFQKLCQVIDKSLVPEEQKVVFQMIDKDNSGSILLEEFKKVFI